MKKLFTLLMTLVLVFSVSDVAMAGQAKMTVSGKQSVERGDEITYTVSLADCDKANTIGIEIAYDDDVLTKDINDTKWAIEGKMQDFDPVKNRGVWTVDTAKNLNGDIFKLAFTVNGDASIAETVIKVTVTVKDDAKVVLNKYTDTIKVKVVCEHVVDKWEKKDADNHVGVCKNCNAKVEQAHNWSGNTCTACKATKPASDSGSGTTKPDSGTTTPGTGDSTTKPDSGTTTPGTGGSTTKPDSGATTPGTGDSNQGSATTPGTDDSNQGSTTTKPDSSTTKPGSTNKGESTTTPETEDATPAVELKETVVQETVDEIQKAEEGKEVVIEMKQEDGKVATVVPVEILEAVKGKDVDVVLDMGEYSWTINGKDVDAEGLKDINLQVTLDTKAVKEDVVKALAGEDAVRQISLKHDGKFNFKAKLTINVGKDSAGKFGNLYYHNDGKLEFMNAAEVDENGDVALEFEHASDYVVVVGRDRTAEEQSQDTSNDVDVPSTEDGDDAPVEGGNGVTIVIVIVVIAVIAVGAYIFLKKKK